MNTYWHDLYPGTPVPDLQNIQKWDTRFIEMAKLVSTWSKDPSTKTGAIIVRPDRTVLSIGYNGFPKGMKDDPNLYADRELKYSRIVHCEMNAVLNAKQSVEGCTLYTYSFASCDRCVIHMIQAGIVRFVFPKLPPELESRWGLSVILTKKYIEEAGLVWTEIE